MKISTKGKYGVRAMFDLAQRYGEGPISLKSIAERQDVSEHYLEQLIAGLRKAGLVKSIRGAHGGYMLALEPNGITVGDIVRVLEGPIAPVECISEDNPAPCKRSDNCVSRAVWERVRDSIANVMDSVSLADMLKEHENKESERNNMFYI